MTANLKLVKTARRVRRKTKDQLENEIRLLMAMRQSIIDMCNRHVAGYDKSLAELKRERARLDLH